MKIPFSIKQSMHGMRLPDDGGGGEGSQQRDQREKNRHSERTENNTGYQEPDYKPS